MATPKREAPWKRKRPPGPRKKLSAAGKRKARASARRAGRRYPNLVDNMNAARTSKRKPRAAAKPAGRRGATRKRKPRAAAKPAGRRGATRKRRPARAALRDPRGGLTPAGRRAFARKEGAHLRPGVTRPRSEMSAEDMRRKGSWARRFYGRKELPALRDAQGRPTRFALTAAAWGEPVPRTPAAARRIAAKGSHLLASAERKRRREGTR